MGSLESAIDETFLVDVRTLPDEALKANIERFSRAINRLNAGLLSQLEVLDRRGAVASEHGSTGAWLREKLNVSATVAGRHCDTPAAWCDIHHKTHWADGGPTSVANGILLCGRHHRHHHRNEHHHDPTGTDPPDDP